MKFFLIAKNKFFRYITQVLLNLWKHKRRSKTPKNKNDFINTEKLPHFIFFPSNKGNKTSHQIFCKENIPGNKKIMN